MTLVALVITIVIGLALEAFFSGSEMALISADRISLRKQADRGSRGAKLALQMLAHPEHLLATTLVGNNLFVAFQAAAVTLYVVQNLGPDHEAYTVAILGPLALVFGEILPKALFQRYAEVVAPRVAPALAVARWFFAPVTWVLGKYTTWLAHRISPIEELITGRHQPSHREELRYLLTYGQKETTLKTSERRMIRRILDFSRAEAKKAFIPLVNVDMIEDGLSVSEALEAFTRHKHTRLPVYHERVDNIVGVLTVFDVFAEEDRERPVTQVMQPAFYAPVTQQLDDLLYSMQKRGLQMAVVVDEYGGAVGVVTLEDILEEIVGDIKDEYDQDTAQYRQLSDREFLVHARMEIDAVNEQLKLNLPHGEYETIGGFLLQQFNRIPEEGDELYYAGLKFVVRKATNRAVQLVHVTVPQA